MKVFTNKGDIVDGNGEDAIITSFLYMKDWVKQHVLRSEDKELYSLIDHPIFEKHSHNMLFYKVSSWMKQRNSKESWIDDHIALSDEKGKIFRVMDDSETCKKNFKQLIKLHKEFSNPVKQDYSHLEYYGGQTYMTSKDNFDSFTLIQVGENYYVKAQYGKYPLYITLKKAVNEFGCTIHDF